MKMNKMETAKLQKILTAYLKEIHEIYAEGNFREESFYSSLEKLFEECSPFFSSEAEIKIRVLPKKTEVGIPDFLIRKNGEIIGHIEAKLPGSNLQAEEESEQLQRYRDALSNLILTNFLELRLFRDGKPIDNVEICKFSALQGLKLPVPEKVDLFFNLLDKFYSFSIPEIRSANELAVVLAKKTKFLKSILEEMFEKESEPDYPYPLITGFYETFRDTLIEGLTKERFVDLYAQTITYGLIAAKLMGKGAINAENAWKFIPKEVELLRKTIYAFTGPNTPEPMAWIVEDILKVLNKMDITAISKDISGEGRDLITHFYEPLLANYNPEERERLGVYYTPPSVVSFIVRSVHKLLKRKFRKEDGFASTDVTLLDPSAGTLSFVIRAVEEAVIELRERKRVKRGLVPLVIQNHILPHFYAFEILMAPYIIGHLRMAMRLEEMAYGLKEGDRIKFYLTNTLEMKEPGVALLLPELSEEGKKAMEVKEKVPILVVITNPPYSVSSENKSEFIEKLMEDYKREVRGERNIQPLSDDYIKFIRFGQWKLERTGKGILGFITNNSYLSGVIHRGMRKRLLESFDEIYILNLRGSSRIGERTPEGGKDENVFDIQQGVSIAIYVKLEKPLGEKKVYYADLWGLRNEKYEYLFENDVESIDWQELEPKGPYYFFVPKDFALQEEYERFWKVTKIFKEWSSGVKTHRDHFVVGFTKEEIIGRLKVFTGDLPDEKVSEALNLENTGTWELKEAREKVKEKKLEDEIFPYAYRPFDVRWICYDSTLIDRPRLPFMEHFVKENLSLVVTRILAKFPFMHVYISNCLSDICLVSAKTKETAYFFPLYLLSDN
jgi:type I restriction-modification system DNA methylase subunit